MKDGTEVATVEGLMELVREYGARRLAFSVVINAEADRRWREAEDAVFTYATRLGGQEARPAPGGGCNRDMHSDYADGFDAGLQQMKARKDAAYLERNQVVAAVAKCFPSGIARTAIEGWSEDWHGCVYIDLPTGQASWHFHDSQAYLFDGLPPYTGTWDGHDTPEKYRRLASLGVNGGSSPSGSAHLAAPHGDDAARSVVEAPEPSTPSGESDPLTASTAARATVEAPGAATATSLAGDTRCDYLRTALSTVASAVMDITVERSTIAKFAVHALLASDASTNHPTSDRPTDGEATLAVNERNEQDQGAPPQAGEGVVSVPVVPTPGMIDAALQAPASVEAMYRAMLAARPPAAPEGARPSLEGEAAPGPTVADVVAVYTRAGVPAVPQTDAMEVLKELIETDNELHVFMGATTALPTAKWAQHTSRYEAAWERARSLVGAAAMQTLEER
jgi:hypothetical protein